MIEHDVEVKRISIVGEELNTHNKEMVEMAFCKRFYHHPSVGWIEGEREKGELGSWRKLLKSHPPYECSTARHPLSPHNREIDLFIGMLLSHFIFLGCWKILMMTIL